MESINLEVGNYAKVYGTKAALDKFQKKYSRHTFLRSSINNWKRKITSGDELQRKKGIAQILLLDFGLFVLYENYICNTKRIMLSRGVMYKRISNRLKHVFSNHVYSCLWWVLCFFFVCLLYFFYYLGWPNLLNEVLLSEIKDIITGTRFAGGITSRRMVVSIGTGVIKANCPEKLKSSGDSLELTGGWVRVLTAESNNQNNSYVKKCLLFRSAFQM